MDDDEYDDDIADEDLIGVLTQASQIGSTQHYPGELDLEIEELPSDAFDSSPSQPGASTYRPAAPAIGTSRKPDPSTQNLRQTTLWGQALRDQAPAQTQMQSKRIYLVDLPPEVPTHHVLNREALKTWIYPTNLGPTRDYQYSIVKNGLFNNTLVALPTGLGKTFIAATVIMNFFRWTKTAKIIFVAPTKPLAAQQVEACLNVAGIPRSQVTLLTGEIAPALREGEWKTKRLLFMTPQTLQNDLGKGFADPKSIVLLVVDEAHRATGDYAYVKVVEFIRRFNPSFRVLALTATPGSKVEGVQVVIDSLGIANIEIRTEESIDIRQYVHSREVYQVVLEPSDEMLQIQCLFSKALRPLCNKLAQVNKWLARDPMSLTTMGLRESQRQWKDGPGRHVNQGTKFMINAIFTILQSLAHSIKLLNYHGIVPFYHKLLDFRSETEEKGEKGSKYKKQIVGDENFQEMMDTIEKWQRLESFVGHPKLTYLCENLLNHFMDAGHGSNTRAIVFSEYRDSAEEIVRTLNAHKPIINASIFVGQADSKRSEGMKQKQQIETIEKFRDGQFNVLVATSIGEEGLDIGQVDLIICYDASASPIRMLQRMGRTGRKRAGNITLLLMKGREEEQYKKAKDNYEKMQKYICEGVRFNFRADLSSRIVPRDVNPEVDMRFVDIPIENTQDPTLPEPKKGGARKKASAKKFHMPDGVITGFMKASCVGKPAGNGQNCRPKKPSEMDKLAEVPDLGCVVLDDDQLKELNWTFRDLPSRNDYEEITAPELSAHPKFQRKLSPVVKLKHGEHTTRCVKLFRKLAGSQSSGYRYLRPYGEEDGSRYKELPVSDFADDPEDDENGDELDNILKFPHQKPQHPFQLDYVDEESGPDIDEVLGTSRKRPRAAIVDDDNEDNSSPPKRRKPVPRARATTAPRQRVNPTTYLDPSQVEDEDDDEEDDEEEEEEEDEEDEGEDASSPPRRGKLKAKGSWRAKPKRNKDPSEDFGDDCTRTSQLYESDGSDSGADLVDFVVDDEAPILSVREAYTSPTTASPSPLSRSTGNPIKDKPYYSFLPPTQASAESDDDMPSMSQICGKKKPPEKKSTGRSNPLLGSSDVEQDDDDEDVVLRKPAAVSKRQKRPVIEDSDSE